VEAQMEIIRENGLVLMLARTHMTMTNCQDSVAA
jgi:hypothetical protein